MYDKREIDRIAEREAKALKKLGVGLNNANIRAKQAENYNRIIFDKLFMKEL